MLVAFCKICYIEKKIKTVSVKSVAVINKMYVFKEVITFVVLTETING